MQDAPSPKAFRMSAAIMAHPKRERFVEILSDSLDRTAPVVWDQHNDRWDTGRRSMLEHDPLASHHLVLQDDAIVCQDLLAGIELALNHVPEPEYTPLALYIGRNKPFKYSMNQVTTKAEREHAAWVRMTQIHWGVGIVMPINLIGKMIDWCDEHPELENYDRRISRWVGTQKLNVYYPWPSLVDHRVSPSLVEGRQSKGRYAYRFVGINQSALSHNWGGPVISLPSLTRTQWQDKSKANARKRRVHRPSHAEWRS